MTNANANSTTINNRTQACGSLAKRCSDLIARREAWELGAYRTSNDQLYEILAAAYELYLHLFKSTQSDDRKQFVNILKERGVVYQANTPLHTRVVRLVFASNRKRSYTYGRVLFAARKDNIKPTDLSNWIRNNNGVEEVKVKSYEKLTPSQKSKADADYASDILAQRDPLITVGTVIAELKPDAEHNPVYSVALVRCDDGRTAEIVWGTNNTAAINKVLAIAGRKLKTDADAAALKAHKRKQSRATRAAISVAAATVRTKQKTSAAAIAA